ncbi:BspA family leucine-rich repeat surface protein [Companilactobacillus muriivasis]|uniref:BspA family leucine-rich repeat surface protein n=1 Tax=Companilactobacillus muriivasis TaxID=3081444 RepID=UPI0030C70C1D
MYLRFLQLKRSGNVKLRNKMKKGKAGWFVVSMCFFGAGLVFMGNPASVHAEVTNGNNPQTESAAQKSSDDKVVPEQPVNKESVGTGNSVARESKSNVVAPEQSVNNALANNGQRQEVPAESNNIKSRTLFQSRTQSVQNGNQIDSKISNEVSSSSRLTPDNTVQADVDSYDNPDNIGKSDPDEQNFKWYLAKNGNLHMVSGTFDGNLDSYGNPNSSFFPQLDQPYVDESNPDITSESDMVNTIVVDGPITFGSNVTGGFIGLKNMVSIKNIQNIDTSQTTSMANLFQGDMSLDKLDLSSFKTEKVTNMNAMFDYSGIEELNLSGMDTSQVTDMTNMFSDMTNIKELDLSSFNTDKVTSLADLFMNDKSLVKVDISGFSGSNLKSINGMFSGCSALESIDLSKIYVTNLGSENSGMFEETTNLKKIKVNGTTLLEGGSMPNIVATKVYTGKWLGDDKSVYDSEDLMRAYPLTGSSKKEVITYTWQKNMSEPTDITLKTTLGDKIIKDVTGPLDSDIEIDAPEVAGYTATPSKVKVHIDENGVVVLSSTGDYDVTYTPTPKKPSGGSSHHSDSNKNTNSVEQLNQTVMTYHNQDNVKLYTMDGQEITNRELYPGSDWFSDEAVTHNNIKYYRVATNELVKAEDALVYVDHADTIVTKDGAPKSLSNEHSQNVSDRKLMSNTAWKTDRYAFFNGTKFYRVATNEWVNAEDVQDNL